jgi:NAD(P)-dependent dehydrogenase (short-subunit alcohol dehydrogenase family)
MNLDLTGKTALITGSTRGIGLASALGLARMGARVCINGRSEAVVLEAAEKIRQAVPEASIFAVTADLGTASGCAELIARVPDADILVNNLGIYEPKPFLELQDADWQRMFDVNVMSGVRLTQHYLGRLLEAKAWGRIVFISSESAIFVPKEMVHYGFSKSAQLVIARGAAEMTKGTEITVNSVLPGPTWVEMAPTRLAARAKAQDTTVEDLAARTFTERRPSSLLQRYAAPEEIANLVCYVCSRASSATNGAVLRADGGIVTNPF